MKASISHLNHQLGIEFEFSCEYNPQQEVVDDATLMQQVVSNQLEKPHGPRSPEIHGLFFKWALKS